MQCGDLERYLEAFLDGRLGRSRGAILRRHLAMCGGCRARVERLRQFERDMQRRFRSMNQDPSIWQGLELDLVASGRSGNGHILALPRLLPAARHDLPPDTGATPVRARHPMLATRSSARSRGSRVAGLVLIAMALGTIYQLARAQLGPDGPTEAAGQVYQTLLQEDRPLALPSGDTERLQAWLAEELGAPVTLPATPSGYQALGAARADLPSGNAAAIIYGRVASEAEQPVLLLVELPEPGTVAEAEASPQVEETATNAGLHELTWSRAPYRFTLVGPGPREELRRFVE